MQKIKVAFYGGCQFSPLARLLKTHFSDRVELLDVDKYTLEKHLTCWKKNILSPFNFLKDAGNYLWDIPEIINKTYSYLDAADVIFMQCFGKYKSLPIGRKNTPDELTHRGLMHKYGKHKKIIGGNFLWFTPYFTQKIRKNPLTDIISFLYLKKGLSDSLKIKQWLAEDTAEEIGTLFSKRLRETLDLNEKMQIQQATNFSSYVPQIDIESTYSKQWIATIPGHPTAAYYKKVLPQYLEKLFDSEPDNELIEQNIFRCMKVLHKQPILKLTEFRFFKTLFPELPDEQAENIVAAPLTEAMIAAILNDIKKSPREDIQQLLAGWADV